MKIWSLLLFALMLAGCATPVSHTNIPLSTATVQPQVCVVAATTTPTPLAQSHLLQGV